MNQYFVTWVIQVDANNPRAAARLALDIQRDPNSFATVFHVAGEGEQTLIDLLEEESR